MRSLLISSHHRPLLVSQLAQVEAAIAQDPGNREWTTLRNDLLEVIELTGELGQIKSTENAPAREVELRTYSVGEKCQAIFEMDGSWYNAKIVALAEDGYFVTFLGYGNTAQVEFNEVRPYQRPDTSLFKPGEEVSAVHSDARWYDAVLNEVKGNVAFVTFKGETEPAEVDLDFVRPKSVSVERKRKQCGSPRSAPPPPACNVLCGVGLPPASRVSAAVTVHCCARREEAEPVIVASKVRPRWRRVGCPMVGFAA